MDHKAANAKFGTIEPNMVGLGRVVPNYKSLFMTYLTIILG